MTEAAHQMTSNPLPPGKVSPRRRLIPPEDLTRTQRKPGTVGLGQGVSVRILDFDSDKEVPEGEVCIKGANVTKGYLNNAKANAESFTQDGYFRTGDRGRLDEDGLCVRPSRPT